LLTAVAFTLPTLIAAAEKLVAILLEWTSLEKWELVGLKNSLRFKSSKINGSCATHTYGRYEGDISIQTICRYSCQHSCAFVDSNREGNVHVCRYCAPRNQEAKSLLKVGEVRWSEKYVSLLRRRVCWGVESRRTSSEIFSAQHWKDLCDLGARVHETPRRSEIQIIGTTRRWGSLHSCWSLAIEAITCRGGVRVVKFVLGAKPVDEW